MGRTFLFVRARLHCGIGYPSGVRILALLPLLLIGCAPTPPAPTVEPAEPPLHLYLLAGQSNMAGRGVPVEIDRTPVPRVFALQQDMSWGPATEPLHWDKPDIVGVGPGFAYGRAMAEAKPDVRIGLIPVAVGGSSIRVWLPQATHESTNARPWDDALSRTFRVLAQEGGELKGIIWHQGESDRADYTAEYEAALVDLVERLRKELRAPELPFVAAQLTHFDPEKSEGTDAINAAIASATERLPNTAVVSGEGFKPKEDGVHLTAESERELGKRYAEAMLKLESAP